VQHGFEVVHQAGVPAGEVVVARTQLPAELVEQEQPADQGQLPGGRQQTDR
jgi:hypothetical protein